MTLSRCLWILFLATQVTATQGITAARAEEKADDTKAEAVVGLTKRVPWTTPGITGSPEPPLPYRAQNAFPKIRFNNPTEVVQVPGSDRLMVTEEKGQVYSFPNRPDAENPDLVIDLAASAPGLDHIFSITFHPQFAKNRYCYIVYALQPKLPDGTRISRFKVSETNPPVIDPASEEIVITWISGGHNGCSLQFGPDGMLYFSAGDSGENFLPTAITPDSGSTICALSIMRIDVDHPAKESAEPGKPPKLYSIPADNPFVDVPGAGRNMGLWAAESVADVLRCRRHSLGGGRGLGGVGDDLPPQTRRQLWLEHHGRLAAGGQ